MSIAVRVSVWILGGLVIVSSGIAVLTLMQKQTLQGQNLGLSHQISEDENKLTDLASQIKKLQDDGDQLNSKLSQSQQDKAQLQSLFDDLKQKSEDLQSQLAQTSSDRDSWKSRVGTVTQERDALMQKFKERPTKIVYKNRVIKVPVNVMTAAPVNPLAAAGGDEYWASVLREKAAMQIELEKEKSILDQAALQVIELKKQNSDLQLEVGQLSNEKDEIIQKIKYGQDLADNLSVDLARSRIDQKEVNDRADKVKADNIELREQIRDLSSTKLDLETNIERLTDEKDAMQKKLIETENVIQGRIDDIWKIKESLDKKLSENAPEPVSPTSPSGVELPPIIVNPPSRVQASSMPAMGKTEGTIISINSANNFVIVDLGQENSSVSVGNTLKVYRNLDQVATLQVIQVRRDICAADIRDKSDELKVGDIVKF